ncbi:MAG: hypothetical protein KBF88_01630 [Polyangiaceae bacterium]|nr:hypothetical protein [Polyangiaceae bacterium]
MRTTLARQRWNITIGVTFLASVACGSARSQFGGEDPEFGNPNADAGTATNTHSGGEPPRTNATVFSSLPDADTQRQRLCARGNGDIFSRALCETNAKITGLADLQRLLGLSFKDTSSSALNGSRGNPAFALLASTTSLSVREVSSINPRVFMMSAPRSWKPELSAALDRSTGMTPPNGWEPPGSMLGKIAAESDPQSSWTSPSGWRPPTPDGTVGTWGSTGPGGGGASGQGGWGSGASGGLGFGSEQGPDPEMAVLTFARGDGVAEVAAFDKGADKLRLFLVKYELDCEKNETCQPGDSYTPESEQNWANVRVYEDVDLTNTMMDCTHCHTAPNGKKTLRMQELVDPWTHWISPWTAGGQALMNDYLNAHKDSETYGGIPGNLIRKSEPRTLELVIHDNGYTMGADTFPSHQIETEVFLSSKGQPLDNRGASVSSTWNALFQTSLKGGIPIPFRDVKTTDPLTLGSVAKRYKGALQSGAVAPSLRDLNKDKVGTGITPPSGATGLQILTQVCTECHQATTDRTLSRSKFDMSRLSSLDRAEKDLAIARMLLPESDPQHMPFAKTRSLSPEQVQLAITELKK